MRENPVIGVIGLGYVGLPLAVAFGALLPTIGFDINARRVAELRAGSDKTNELSDAEMAAARHLQVTDQLAALSACNVFIITVPTPVDQHKQPDLTPLISASRMVAGVLRPGAVVVYESTVYPGATEEVCVPLLEAGSGLAFNAGFTVGYSPERINPGDKVHRLANIVKVVSGSTPETTAFLAGLYGRIVTAGIHKASCIRVAEAAKVIENTQRDINIALINELAMLFNRMGIDTQEVLEAAGSKWNFLPFRPGLVGGHCIGVDPYYLTHKAQAIGYHPEIILAGRRINDGMGGYVANQVIATMIRNRIPLDHANVLVMGLTFKEDCPDLRNTRVIDIIHELGNFNLNVAVHDPWADAAQAHEEYGVELLAEPQPGRYQAVVLAVAHQRFREMGIDTVRRLCAPGGILYDVKHLFPKDQVHGRL